MLADDQLRALASDVARSTLGRQALEASPWQFVPAASAKLERLATTQGSATELANELRFTMAVALARLGLRTTTLESLEGCEHPARLALRELVERMPDDAVATKDRVETCRASLAVVRGDDRDRLLAAFPAWAQRQSSVRGFRAGASLVLQDADARWLLFADDAAMAATIDSSTIKSGPCYLDGFHAPATIRRLFESTNRPAHEARVRLVLLAASEDEALTNLSLGPMVDALASPRVEVWCGPTCADRVRRDAEDRLECALGVVIGLPSPPACGSRWPTGAIGAELARVRSLQDELESPIRARVDAWNAGLDASRVFAAERRDWRGLRVLMPTSRFTTYVQHAASDLARTFERIGCIVKVMKEPDDHSTLTPLAFLRAVDSFRPDLVVFINTLRSQIPEAAPSGVPAVTWVQDAMTHLFSERAGRSMGPQDFVVGHLHAELFDTFDFPRERTMASVVLASEEKFHAAPVPQHLRERFECEIAYVSHQSQTPEQVAANMIALGPEGTTLANATQIALPLVIRCIADSSLAGPPMSSALRDIAERSLASVSIGIPAPSAIAAFQHQVVHPIAERALRQQMVGWASDLCEREGWRLHLYGKGWESSSRFAKHSRGTLEHGEELRAAYQCARTHLHAGLGGPHHQRVLECALSGGCTLVRIRGEDARLLEWWAQNELTRDARAEQFTTVNVGGQPFLMAPVADHWQAMMAHAAMDRLGLPQQHPHRGMQAVGVDQLHEAPAREPVPLEAAWLMGDPSETAFWCRESFERAARAVVTLPCRRESLHAWQSRAAREHFGLERFARRMLDLVARSLHPAPAMSRSG